MILKTFTSKKGNTVVVRTPVMEDIPAMTDYMNEISREDTFISFGGEQLSIEAETEYMKTVLQKIEKGEALKVFAFIGGEMVGNADITKEERRSKHVAILGITIKDGYREEGIGRELMNVLIEEAIHMDLRMLQLDCFANNPRAIHLYEKCGFQTVGKIPGKYFYRGGYIDSVVMVKEL